MVFFFISQWRLIYLNNDVIYLNKIIRNEKLVFLKKLIIHIHISVLENIS